MSRSGDSEKTTLTEREFVAALRAAGFRPHHFLRSAYAGGESPCMSDQCGGKKLVLVTEDAALVSHLGGWEPFADALRRCGAVQGES